MGSKLTTLKPEQTLEANKRAWDAVFEKYPPAPDAVPLESLADYLAENRRARKIKKLVGLTEAEEARFEQIGDTDDLASEVTWVYHNLANDSVEAATCPSRGAWEMLDYARKNKGWFFEKMHRPLAQQISKQKSQAEEGEYKPSKAEKLAVEEMDKMIREAVAESQLG